MYSAYSWQPWSEQRLRWRLLYQCAASAVGAEPTDPPTLMAPEDYVLKLKPKAGRDEFAPHKLALEEARQAQESQKKRPPAPF